MYMPGSSARIRVQLCTGYSIELSHIHAFDIHHAFILVTLVKLLSSSSTRRCSFIAVDSKMNEKKIDANHAKRRLSDSNECVEIINTFVFPEYHKHTGETHCNMGTHSRTVICSLYSD